MNWQEITSIEDIQKIKELSQERKVMIFKHSTSCGISNRVLSELEIDWREEETHNLKIFYLDLLAHRDVSNAIADDFNIRHQSPQILMIENGVCYFDTSHWNIKFDLVKENL